MRLVGDTLAPTCCRPPSTIPISISNGFDMSNDDSNTARRDSIFAQQISPRGPTILSQYRFAWNELFQLGVASLALHIRSSDPRDRPVKHRSHKPLIQRHSALVGSSTLPSASLGRLLDHGSITENEISPVRVAIRMESSTLVSTRCIWPHLLVILAHRRFRGGAQSCHLGQRNPTGIALLAIVNPLSDSTLPSSVRRTSNRVFSNLRYHAQSVASSRTVGLASPSREHQPLSGNGRQH